MEKIAIYLFSWIIVMTLLLTFIPKDRIPLITKFFEKVLPKIPFTGMIDAWKRSKK